VIGGRSSAKSTDSARIGALQLINNIQRYTKLGKLYKIMLMRQNGGAIAKSIGADFWTSYNILKNTPELKNNTILLETEIKGNKKGETFVFGKGFNKSKGTDTAVTKGFSGINTVIIDEAEEVNQSDFEQLEGTAIRENTKIILICNTPHKDHWICKKYLNLLPSKYEGFYNFEAKPIPNLVLVKSNIQGNVFLSDEARETYFDYGNLNSANYDLKRYCKDVLGLVTGDIKGKIFSNYKTCSNKEFDELEAESKFGMDFGFSNDPATLVECKITNNVLYVKEWFYETGITKTSEKLEYLGISKRQEIKADSGGLGVQLIAQMVQEGWNIKSAQKGAGSVKAGILQIQNFAEVRICKSSYNTLQEFNLYSYKLDAYGVPTTEPDGKYDHIIDAIRYAIKQNPKPTQVPFFYF
jgi:phage terminase large subunit